MEKRECLSYSHSMVLGLKDKEIHHAGLQEVTMQQTSFLARGDEPGLAAAVGRAPLCSLIVHL